MHYCVITVWPRRPNRRHANDTQVFIVITDKGQTLKLASWNVNSLRVRLPHLLRWLASESPDLIGLQETKLVDEKFPIQALHEAGYHAVFSGQPTYNGVAILIRKDRFEEQIEHAILDARLPDDQRRMIVATVRPRGSASAQPIRFMNVYVPNGSEVGSDKYDYKLRWLDILKTRVSEELGAFPRFALVGDFNIAPEDRDVYDPQAWKEKILCSTPERLAFQSLLDMGLIDSFRQHCQDTSQFSWWDYRQGGFRRGMGLRIDHVLLSEALARQCTSSTIDKDPRGWEQPSDHAPVLAIV